MPARRRIASLVIALSALPALGQPAHQHGSTKDAVERELAALPYTALMDAVRIALADKADPALRLTSQQSAQIRAANEAFKAQVIEFLRTHADGTNSAGAIPSRQDAERRIMELLTKDQRKAVDRTLRESAARRSADRQSQRSGESSSSKDSQGSSQTSSQSSSQTSSQRSNQSSSQSSHQSSSNSSRQSNGQSDRQSAGDSKRSSSADKSGQSSSNKSDSNKSDSTDKPSSGSSSSQKSGAAKPAAGTSRSKADSWSKLDAHERRAVIRDLLNQLPDQERRRVSQELGISDPL